jgi:murein DD-endopeptidase MepM/ murein hydrolase activator NlpD
MSQGRRRWTKWIPVAAAGATALLVTSSFVFYGPRGLERYPPKETSPYRLPFAGSRWVCQGNNGSLSHSGWQEFAFDFRMPEDTPVLAARGGVVSGARSDRDSIGRHAPANFVAVAHDDGTTAWYLHLRKDGVLVKPGQRVRQGEEIGRSGWTGIALIPHLHFHVTDARGDTVPVTFSDDDGDGIPRAPWFAGR